MKAMSTYVIQRPVDGKFWCAPKKWSEEYPDAQKFDAWAEATHRALAAYCVHDGDLLIVADYGLDVQRVLLAVQGRPHER